jgi:quercetin dioxygenase-like cupin family protein
MSHTCSYTRSNLNGFWLSLAIAGTLTGLLVLGATAASAACPPGKETTDGQKAGATAHKGVEEKLLGLIDLSKEKVNVPGRLFRMRQLVVQPGGEVAWHSHEDRPALIYIVSGTITEYSSHCSVPIEHPAGDLSIEQAGLSHWWKNNSKEPTTLISADIAKDPNEHGM